MITATAFDDSGSWRERHALTIVVALLILFGLASVGATYLDFVARLSAQL